MRKSSSLPPKPRRPRSSIRWSTDADVKAIHSWLIDEDKRGIDGNFLSNWNLTERCHRERDLLVYIDGESGIPVAYQLGDLTSPGLLQVRHDMRRKGVGRKLVERRVAEAYKHDHCLLVIQCEPSSSFGFWRKMGFTLFNDVNGQKRAYRVLKKKHRLPIDGRHVTVTVRLFPESRKWDDTVNPYESTVPRAVATPDGTVYLAERVYCFSAVHSHVGDSVVEIKVDGQLRYCDKAKYPTAESVGVRCCRNGFYIDKVTQLG